jgi:hypothetical protein
MTPRLDAVPAAEFIRSWNGAGTLDEAVLAVKAVAGGPVPRWAVRARAVALEKIGARLKRFPVGAGGERGRPGVPPAAVP